MKGRVAFVTGAGQGIGRACALALAEAGARVVLGARSVDKLEAVAEEIRAAGGEAHVAPIDLSSLESIQAIQSDHVNFPYSICKHDPDKGDSLDNEKTINALVIDLTAREMHIAWGNPCQNEYGTYRLDA